VSRKFIEMICFSSFEIFHIYLIQIYFESKYLKNAISNPQDSIFHYTHP